ncbi:MAG: hypothetical protein CME01_13475 [Geminicoccus sp.]|uniref:DUF403 domain-containing protein n=1 Tax=Stieleria bergensis TaxID=2528025 RepID=A0A517SQE0_9BACT|nr:hypothetical protein [Geminicoccus sp.]QDT58338.1 hypothetical protein SV7mr_08280 [Planctomycetes bacterium SV_7m_r]
MLSRVAESIYWMGRQVERAENLARFLEVTLQMTLEHPDTLVDPWTPLVEVTGDQKEFAARYGRADPQNVVQFLGFDRDYSSSMVCCLRAARENARGVRESISTEAFEQLNDFYHFVRDAGPSQLSQPTGEFFVEIRNHALMWTGVLDSTMSHDLGWQFLNAGRLIERADKTSRILDAKYFNLLPRIEDVGTAVDDLQWSNLLLAISGFEAYRREHHLMDIEKIVSFFIFHKTFTRSIYACVAGADWSVREIHKQCDAEFPSASSNQIASLRHRLQSMDVKEVLSGGMHRFIDDLQTQLNEIGQAIANDYFNAIGSK